MCAREAGGGVLWGALLHWTPLSPVVTCHWRAIRSLSVCSLPGTQVVWMMVMVVLVLMVADAGISDGVCWWWW